MTVTVLPAVGLLERAVGYTRGALAGVTATNLTQPTPCRGWDLRRLLHHMDDALAAFTEASAGHVRLDPIAPGGPTLERVRQQACALLGAWAEPTPAAQITVGDRRLPTDLLVRAGALEIALHGWDVARATGRPTPLPEDLARRLLLAATTLIGPADRPSRFGPEQPVAPDASYADRLVALSGRHP